MKRIIFTFLSFASLASLNEAKAQLALTDFNSGLPSTWSMIKVDNNTPSTNLNSVIIAGLTSNAWMTRLRATGDSCMLTASSFTSPAFADRWLVTPSFMVTDAKTVLKWEDAEGVAGANDSLEVWVSTTGGTVSDFTTKIYSGPVTQPDAGGNVVFGTKGAALGTYNGQTIRVAFRNHSYNQGTSRIDNVQTVIAPNAVDGAVISASSACVPKMSASPSSVSVEMAIQNLGASNITSVDVTYQVDAGTPVAGSISGMIIYPFSTLTLNVPTPITTATAGQHTVTMNLVNVNGSPDPVTSNNSGTSNFVIATQSVVRNGVIEEFSSSTCVPCSQLNATFDPIATNSTNNANVPSTNFNLVRYQMNWPAPGTDASYNPQGVTRQTYYSVNSIPEAFVNGEAGTLANNSTATQCQNEIDNSKTGQAFMDITGTYLVDNVHNTLSGNVTVTPYFTLSGNYSVLIVAAERHYQNTANTTGQLDYYRVERMMFPNGNGTSVSSWAAGTAQSFPYSGSFVVGSVAQGNDNFWGSPANSDLVVFVQDNSDKSVLQSISIPAGTLAVPSISEVNSIMLYPNPAKDIVNVSFELADQHNIGINIVDAIGKVVYSSTEQLNVGKHMVTVPTGNFTPGVYYVTIKSEGGSTTTHLSIVK